MKREGERAKRTQQTPYDTGERKIKKWKKNESGQPMVT